MWTLVLLPGLEKVAHAVSSPVPRAQAREDTETRHGDEAVLFKKRRAFKREVHVHMFGDAFPSLTDLSILHRQLLPRSNARGPRRCHLLAGHS